MIRSLALALLAVMLFASCDWYLLRCDKASSTYEAAIKDPESMRAGTKVEGQVFVYPSQQVEGAWFISASVDGSVAVWATHRNPQGKKLGLIVVANDTARQHSILGIDVSRDSPVAEELALDDARGIATAEDCVAGGDAP